ncbi:MAG TPA: hypothetical protein VKP65_05870, partial [Rhodothermales bacterium]|nr:hypothetical protein [Rhodothermales bacterium]
MRLAAPKRALRALVLLLSLTTLLALDAYAQKPRTTTGLEISDPTEVDRSVYQTARRINARTSAPEALYHVGFQATPDTPEAM